MHVVDVLYHDRSVGAIGDAHAGNVEARSIAWKQNSPRPRRDGDVRRRGGTDVPFDVLRNDSEPVGTSKEI